LVLSEKINVRNSDMFESVSGRKLVVIGILGTTLDAGKGNGRWNRWRPSVALTQHQELRVDRFELLCASHVPELAAQVIADIEHVSPETKVVKRELDFDDAWDFEHVYGKLRELATSYPFDLEKEDYLVHITTGTHVAQICLFLLTESRHFPARLLQTAPNGRASQRPGKYTIIDLDLSKYDRLAARFRKEKVEARSFLKQGIQTKNAAFNALIDRIEQVSIASRAPLLLTGPTGAGKSRLAQRIYELKKQRRQVAGAFAELNCATLRGDAAMSMLFGHVKGAFTGAASDRAGMLRKADKGVLFLDEVGELGPDEQAMLLRAIEEKVFYPLGSDKQVSSDFQLICGTNRDLRVQIARGEFREDLFARINLWTFALPSLRERPEDIPPNLDFQLEQVSQTLGVKVTMSKEARASFSKFAATWSWPGNFRDFDASVTRMATLAEGGRVTEQGVADELERLQRTSLPSTSSKTELVAQALGSERALRLDRFDRVQLEDVLAVCHAARSLSAAGRELFAASRSEKASVNDADRLRKYLARFDLDFASLKEL
jgi:transcriptional regulatory protein RtcR